jgi:hypothetical protein
MRRKLSSNITPVYKFLLPGLWLFCATYAVSDYISAAHDQIVSVKFLATCVFWAIGGAIFFFSFGRLKRVYSDDSCLYVSNYLKEIKISLDQVESVRQSGFWTSNINRIVVRLKSPSGFGRQIEFSPMPPANQIVTELTQRFNCRTDESDS